MALYAPRTVEISEAYADKGAASDTLEALPAFVLLGKPLCICGDCERKHYVCLIASQPELCSHILTTHPPRELSF
jgi:hypothetical protein